MSTFHDRVLEAVRDVVRSETQKEVAADGKILTREFKKLVESGVFPKDYIKQLERASTLKEKSGGMRRMELEAVMRDSGAFLRHLHDHVQRKRGDEVERARLRVKYGEQFGEVYLLDDIAYIVKDIDAAEKIVHKATLLPNGSLGAHQESSIHELEHALLDKKIPQKVFIKEPIFEDLKKIFGKDVEVLLRR